MNGYKRLLLVLTSLVIMVTACGCSIKPASSKDETTESDTTTAAEVTTSITTTAAPVTTATAATVEEESVALDMDLVMGSVADGVYVNEYFDFSLVIPSAWFFDSDDEIMEYMGIDSADVDTDEERQEVLSTTQLLWTAISYDLLSESRIYVTAENLNILANGSHYTVEAYIQRDIKDFEDLEYTFGDIEEIDIGSHPYYMVSGDRPDDDGNTITVTFVYKRDDISDFIFSVIIYTYGDADWTEDDVVSWMSDAMTPSEAATPATTQATTTATAPVTTAEASVEEKPASEEVIGYVKNRTYFNEYLDLKFAPGSDWTFDDEDALLERMGTEDGYSLTDCLEAGEAVIICYALPDLYSSNVMMYCFDASDAPSYTAYDAISYYAGSYAESGYTVGEIEELEIGFNSYCCVEYELTDTLPMYGSFIARRVGDYMYLISIYTSGIYGLPLDDIVAMFS